MTKTEEQYVLVTVISSYRIRYCVPMSELQKMNEDATVDPMWALDAVSMDEVKEFSQEHLGEQISDMRVLTEEEILSQFDAENEYLSRWTRDQKLKYIKKWKETY